MKADLFIKVVLFLEHWLNSCSEKQFREVSKIIDCKYWATDEEPWKHLDDFLDTYHPFQRDDTEYLPNICAQHIVNLLVWVDRFYVDGDWDDIKDASRKLENMFNASRELYDEYDSFFFDFSWDYGDNFRSCRLLYEDPTYDDDDEEEDED